MRVDWAAVWQFLTATDERTWVGHGLQGVLFGFLGGLTGTGHGVIFTLGAFGHREADEYWRWLRAMRLWKRQGYSGVADVMRRTRRRKMLDSFMDLWAPFAGAILAESALLLLRP